MNSLVKDRVIGMFLGIAIGDALGLPVETMTAEQIAGRYGRIVNYQDVTINPYFPQAKAGEVSDDTQLSVAVAESLITCGKINIDDLAYRHIEAMKKTSQGWGRSTKRSVVRLAEGVHWEDSGEKGKSGNGVAMKVAPLGAYFACKNFQSDDEAYFYWLMVYLARMTHNSVLGVDSILAQVNAISMALLYQGQVDRDSLKEMFFNRILQSLLACPLTEGDRLSDRIELLRDLDLDLASIQEIAAMFGGATCYVYNSLPFVYAIFIRNPWSIETLYDTVSAGGDTDTNGSMVGALLGALNGKDIFPEHLVNGLSCRDQIFDLAEKFCDRFGIK